MTGTAWLDHEWSESPLHPEAVGWDWIGMNLDSGAALTACAGPMAVRCGWGQLAGQCPCLRRRCSPQSCQWVALRHWLSLASQARYPVQWRVDTRRASFEVRALLDAQELDCRAAPARCTGRA